MTRPLKTPAKVKAEFVEAGISQAEWARTHRVSLQAVKDVLRGKSTGTRGEAHRVAVALGLKHGVTVASVKAFKPAPPALKTTAPRRQTKAA